MSAELPIYRGRRLKRADGRWITYARWLMQEHLGRQLGPDEIVHHVNGDPLDDRIENFRLVTRAEHIALHREEMTTARWGVERITLPPCIDCGVELSETYCTRCVPCNSAKLAAEYAAERDARARRISAMWAEGRSTAEIARAVGMKTESLRTHIRKLRRLGYSLPRRGPGGRPLDPEGVIA